VCDYLSGHLSNILDVAGKNLGFWLALSGGFLAMAHSGRHSGNSAEAHPL
jgi:hypothetical protein